MVDLNMMMREQARNGLQAQLDKAVTEGDQETVRKLVKDIEALAVQTAPKPPPFGDADIRAELDKQAWFGTDPKKSAKAMEFGKTMDLKKFATAAAFAKAITDAVEAEFKTATATTDEDEDDEDEDDKDDKDDAPPPKKKRTDGPGDSDTGARTTRRATSGPWTKLSDAPADVQKDIRRATDKFVSSGATKEQRESFISKALESHHAIAQRAKGKK